MRSALTDVSSTLMFFLLAAFIGGLAGFVSDLLILRGSRDSGVVEKPGRRGDRYVDLGWWASALIGGLAGAIGAGLFAVQELPDGGRGYQPWRMVVIALVAGLAGPQFLKAVRQRVLAAVDQARVEQALQLAKAELEERRVNLVKRQGLGETTVPVAAEVARIEVVTKAIDRALGSAGAREIG